MERIKRMVLRSRHTLLVTSIFMFIALVVVEGKVMERESRLFSLENRFFEFNATNIEEFEVRRNRDR